ncbi:MAG: c-type cytochrome [Magnetovibrio sp.]|nr:c-type cytochrome [Magnetovibrio sp.]
MKRLKTPMLRVAACAAIAFGVVSINADQAYAFPWSTDMMNQPSIKPQEQIKPFPKRSVPVGGIPSQQWADRDATEDLKNPFPADAASLKKGKMLFTIYCTACHGMTGRAESEVAARGMPATDLTDDDVQIDTTEGWIFGTITFGSAIMPPYGRAGDENGELRGSNDLSVAERWHVVNYVKHQLKADAIAAGPLPE